MAKLVRRGKVGWTIDASAKAYLENCGEEAKPYIWTLLSDQPVEVRRGAAFFLVERFDPSRPEHVAAFQAALSDQDESIRHIGLEALSRLPNDLLAPAAPRLAALLERDAPSASNRAAAARLIGRLGVEGRRFFPHLARAAKQDASATVRKACLFAASRMGEAERFAELCREVLARDPDAGMRRQAAMRLAQLGRGAARAAAELAAALDDEDEDVRFAARDALVRIGKPAVPPLIAQLDADSPTTRQLAIFALGKLGAAAKPALPALQKLAEDDDQDVRQLAKAVIKYLQSAQ